ncbi:cupin domain-containing protein [Hyphomicrobium sp. NDB2Meth4]|uniref:cupin domain-containing protein n=1 Tax=Hyphomicrobium sp. NDB2Meth4 TaxID=1892846 RepID=UPI000B0BDE10|nr:cupin domain-containing protein [Hyphomicrobium sp. NDB2Meth4]
MQQLETIRSKQGMCAAPHGNAVAWKDALGLALVVATAGSLAFLAIGHQLHASSRVQQRRAEEIASLLATLRKDEANCTTPAADTVQAEMQPDQQAVQGGTMRKMLVAAAMMAVAGTGFAHDASEADGAKELAPAEIVFRDDPAFPKGAQTALLHGDPTKPGLFILRLKFPPNYLVPPHTHPGFETVTVLSGSMGSGMGKKADLTKGKMLDAGGMLALPANHAHYVWTTDKETIIQVAAVGPFDLIYINPEDDPRTKK